jgi:hypothetical protein
MIDVSNAESTTCVDRENELLIFTWDLRSEYEKRDQTLILLWWRVNFYHQTSGGFEEKKF